MQNLDRWQAVAIYLVPRDKQGAVIATGASAPPLSFREAFCAFWRARCLPAWRVEELWDLHRTSLEKGKANGRPRRKPRSQRQ